jgi:hypothetical protein
MAPQASAPRAGSPWRLLLGILCIGLILLGGTISVAHSHSDGDVSHADCALCVAVHITVHSAATPTITPVANVFATVHIALPPVRPDTLASFALYTRPPPANANLS